MDFDAYVFDPFGDYIPDFENFVYDVDEDVIYDEEGKIYPSKANERCKIILQEGFDPNINLKEILTAEYCEKKPCGDDPTDIMPKYIFHKVENGIYFEDSSFVAPTLRSEQNCSTNNLEGYIILPAKYATRIRSRGGNHGKPTPCLYTNDENFAQGIKNYFN